jgi:glutamate 5-kinase
LLPIGVTSIKGKFSKGDVIFVKDLKGNHIASGITNYSSDEAKKIVQKKSSEIKKIFGNDAKSELIHLNNLVLINN